MAADDFPPDLGERIVNDVYAVMNVDAEWTSRQPRGFTWWGHRLAQRVWTELGYDSLGYQVFRIHVESDILRGVPGSEGMLARLSALNTMAALSAYQWNPTSQRVSLACSVIAHAETAPWLTHLLVSTAGLQAAEASIAADHLPELLGGEVDATEHPVSGPRHDPDDWLNVIRDTFAPAGQQSSPWHGQEILRTARASTVPWLLVTQSATGFTAELPFGDGEAALIRIYTGKGEVSRDEKQALMARIEHDARQASLTADEFHRRLWASDSGGRHDSALMVASADERHPRLGNGLLLRCHLPTVPGADHAAAMVHTLNSGEQTAKAGCHFLGAWTVDPEGHLTCVMFIPAINYSPNLLQNLVLSMGVRMNWARQFLATS